MPTEAAALSEDGEAIEQAMASSPDVIVMDIRMPRMDGIEATRRLAGDERVPAQERSAT